MDDAAYEALMARLNEAYPSQPAYTPADVKLQSGQITQQQGQDPVMLTNPRILQQGESNPIDFDQSGGVSQLGAMMNAGRLRGMLDMSAQDGMTPGYNAMGTMQLPEGYSASYRRSNEIGGLGDAQNAIMLAKQFGEPNTPSPSLSAGASRSGMSGPITYDLFGSVPLTTGRNPEAPQFRLPSSREEQPMVPLSRRDRERQPSHQEVKGAATAGLSHSPRDHSTSANAGLKFNFADGGHVDAALHLLRQHFDEGGFLDSLRGMFSGPDYLSTGDKLVDDGRVNWGNPENPADFARAAQADRALRLAREVQARDDDVTGSTPAAKAPARAPIEATELPPSAFTPVTPYDLGVPLEKASMRAPTEKLEARAPQDGEVTNEQILAAIRANESRNRPMAQNPRSSAGGLYQFINSTWGNTLRRMDPEQYGGYSDRQLRGLKTDPNAVDVQHAAANYHLTNDIAPVLSRAGVPLTPGSAYLSWFQGPGGAVKAYTAPDDATVAEVFPRTVSANANMRFNGKPYAQWTMSDLRQWADTAMAKRMGRADGGIVDDALHVVREHHADGEAVGQAPETNALGMTPNQFAEYTQTKAPPAPGFIEGALRNVREYAMPRAEDYTHAMDQSAAAADYLTKSGKEGMLSGNPWEMAKGAGKSMLGTALPVIAPVGAAFEAGIINPAERVLGPAGRQAAEVATMVPGEGVGAALKIARATGEAAPYAAIFAGPMAKTADIHALEIAKDLATKGADRGEIIGKTGWFQGSDGKWRFEIPDVQSKVTDQVYNNIKEKGIHEGTLPTALEHPELYEAYPQLNEMQATFGASAKPRGSYSPWSKDISVEGPSVANQRSTALHEAQHAVQQIEDFARGADNIYLKPNTPAWDIYQERLKAIKTPMTPKQFEESGVGSPKYSYSEYLKQTKDSIKNNGPMLDRAAQDYAVQEAYRRSAGEVEARNVQARRNMNPSALKAEMPWQTQSVPNEQQIVKFHNTEPQMSAPAYQGEHTAPMKDSGSPLYNVTGVYPKDFYSGKGFQYYADLGSEKNMDRSSYGTINSYLGMPDRPITVYRAVPKDPDIKGINKGDWVTINRDYAKEHGQGALNGDYKILKKQVYARDLFTAGDSHHEWGYDPQPASGFKREDKAAMRKDVRGYENGGSVEDRALSIVRQ